MLNTSCCCYRLRHLRLSSRFHGLSTRSTVTCRQSQPTMKDHCRLRGHLFWCCYSDHRRLHLDLDRLVCSLEITKLHVWLFIFRATEVKVKWVNRTSLFFSFLSATKIKINKFFFSHKNKSLKLVNFLCFFLFINFLFLFFFFLLFFGLLSI